MPQIPGKSEHILKLVPSPPPHPLYDACCRVLVEYIIFPTSRQTPRTSMHPCRCRRWDVYPHDVRGDRETQGRSGNVDCELRWYHWAAYAIPRHQRRMLQPNNWREPKGNIVVLIPAVLAFLLLFLGSSDNSEATWENSLGSPCYFNQHVL